MLFSCDQASEMPQDVLSKEEFIPVFLDVQILEATYKQRILQQVDQDSMMQHNYAYIFDKHNISRPQFESSFSWWASQPEEMSAIYDEIDRLIIEMETELRNQNINE